MSKGSSAGRTEGLITQHFAVLFSWIILIPIGGVVVWLWRRGLPDDEELSGPPEGREPDTQSS